MSLPKPWVDRIFEKLALVYGREFLNRWDGVPLDEVKADWAHELAGFGDQPQAIAYALQTLPADRAPNVLQFRDLCRRAPPPERQLLNAPKANPELVAEQLARVREMVAGLRSGGKALPAKTCLSENQKPND